MDVLVTRPGGVSRFLVDIATCDARAARSGDCSTAFAQAEHDKTKRYDGSAWPLAIELRGKLGPMGADLLDLLAGEAAILTGARPTTLTRKWRRQLQLVTAFEMAETMRGQLCGLDDVGLAAASAKSIPNSFSNSTPTASNSSSGSRHKPAQPTFASLSSRPAGVSACALQDPLPQFGLLACHGHTACYGPNTPT